MKITDIDPEYDGEHTGMNLWALDEEDRGRIFTSRAARAARAQRLANEAADKRKAAA